MNHAYFPLRSAAVRLTQPFYNMYLVCLRYHGGTPALRLLGIHGRAKAVVLFDRVMAGETRGVE